MIDKDRAILVDDCLGIYAPQRFAEDYKSQVKNADELEEEFDILKDGPSNEQYWDAWDHVINNAVLVGASGKEYWIELDDGGVFATPIQPDTEWLGKGRNSIEEAIIEHLKTMIEDRELGNNPKSVADYLYATNGPMGSLPLDESLMYTRQIVAFIQEHAEAIDELLAEYEDAAGEPAKVRSLGGVVWLAVEMAANNLATAYEMES